MKSQNSKKKLKLKRTLFVRHLEKLELLSLATRRITERLPHNANAEKTVNLMWDVLSKSIPSEGTAEIGDLNTLSSIIQRTASSAKQIQSLEDDSVDFCRKVVDFESTRIALLESLKESAAADDHSGEITQQTIALIEKHLNLL